MFLQTDTNTKYNVQTLTQHLHVGYLQFKPAAIQKSYDLFKANTYTSM